MNTEEKQNETVNHEKHKRQTSSAQVNGIINVTAIQKHSLTWIR